MERALKRTTIAGAVVEVMRMKGRPLSPAEAYGAGNMTN